MSETKDVPPHKAENSIPPQIIDATDNNNEVSDKQLHTHESSTKEAPICPVCPEPSVDAAIAEDLNDVRSAEDNNNAHFSSGLNGCSNINHKSVESTRDSNSDTAYDLSDEEQFGALDFSDSDLPDSPEIEKSAMSFQKQEITENSSSETEQENNSDIEEFNPFTFRKKKSKKSSDTVDLNTLPTRISTRYRKPVIENVTAKILKPTYLTEQESQIDGDIVAENIKRLKIHNELKSVLKSSNENKSQNKTDASNNDTKELSTNSDTEITTSKRDDSNKHQEQNKTEIENLNSASATTITRMTRSNSKITQHKPFELACARFQEEINASIEKNRSFYKSSEKERSKSPELIGRLKIPQETMKQVLQSSQTVSTPVEPPTQVATSSDSKDTRNGPQKTMHRRSIPHETPKQISPSFGAIVTRNKLKEPWTQTVSKPCVTVVTQDRPPDPPKLVSTSSDSVVTRSVPQEPKTQVSKPTKTLITRSRAQFSICRRNNPQNSRTQVSSDTVLTRNRGSKSVITSSRVKSSKVVVTKDSQKLLSKYPKIVLTSIKPQDYSKQVTASSNSVVTRRRLKDFPKQVSQPSETGVRSTAILRRSPEPRQEEVEALKSSEMVVIQTRRQKTIRSELQIDESKLTDNVQIRPQQSKTSKLCKPEKFDVSQSRPQKALVTQNKLQKATGIQNKSVTTRSRPEKTVKQARPKPIDTQNRPQKPLVMQNKVQKNVVTQENLLKTVTTRSRPEKTVVTQIRSQKPVVTQSRPQKPVVTENKLQKVIVTQKKLIKSVTTRSRPKKSVTQVTRQKTVVTQNRPQTTKVSLRTQNTAITQTKPQQTSATKRPRRRIKRQRNIEKIEDGTVKVTKSFQKTSSGSTKCNISSSAESRRSLKRSLPCSDVPSCKRKRVHKTSNVNNASSQTTPIHTRKRIKKADSSRIMVTTKPAVNRRNLRKKPSFISQ